MSTSTGDKLRNQSTLTFRDMFAMAALVGRCARDDGSATSEADAEYCYTQADAMLKEREKS